MTEGDGGIEPEGCGKLKSLPWLIGEVAGPLSRELVYKVFCRSPTDGAVCLLGVKGRLYGACGQCEVFS